MARQSRQPSGTGIYHVMMRGINHQNILYNKLNDLVNTPLSDDVSCLNIEDTSKGRPSDNQVMLLIKEKTGVTNSSAFQQLPEETKRSVLIELKGMRASLRQLEIDRNREKYDISYVMKQKPVPVFHPDVSFNLVFAMVHIYRHFFSEGIGLRQLKDYYFILKLSTSEERAKAMNTFERLHMRRVVVASVESVSLGEELERESLMMLL